MPRNLETKETQSRKKIYPKKLQAKEEEKSCEEKEDPQDFNLSQNLPMFCYRTRLQAPQDLITRNLETKEKMKNPRFLGLQPFPEPPRLLVQETTSSDSSRSYAHKLSRGKKCKKKTYTEETQETSTLPRTSTSFATGDHFKRSSELL